MFYRLTPLSILLTIFLLIPATLVGGLAAYVYRGFLHGYVDGSLIDWITGGWISALSHEIFPNLIHGGIAGYLSIFVCSKITRKANYEIVAYSVAAIVIAFSLVGAYAAIIREGFGLGTIALVSNTSGIVIGLFCALVLVREEQQIFPIKDSENNDPVAKLH